MSLQETKITKSKSKYNLQEDALVLPKINSSTNFENITSITSLPKIASSNQVFCQEDENLQAEVKKEIELTLMDFNIPENIKSAYYFVKNFNDNTDPAKIQTLRKSLPIFPSYFNTNGMQQGIDYFHLIKDHIRNHRRLNKNHIKYIRECLSSEQKIEIIKLYNDCCASLVDVLEKT